MRLILDLCAGTGSWSRPYAEAGYDVRHVDLPDDVRLMTRPGEPVHGILAAPPCTVFASSGARWPRTDDDTREWLSVVDACLRLVVACLWGEFSRPRETPVEATEFWGWRRLGGRSARTKRLRSMTPPGFARAFFEANP